MLWVQGATGTPDMSNYGSHIPVSKYRSHGDYILYSGVHIGRPVYRVIDLDFALVRYDLIFL